uniref:mannose-6-phosphate isomerase n=1 Tax=Haemonchus contortus TaxID=6289 RepID=A0A7I4YS12_HAECO
MQRLECHVKKYNWGKRGTESEVARLFAAGHKNFVVDEEETYAELWMGTHPDGPAMLSNSGTRLSSFIAKSHSAGYLSNNNWKEDIHLPFIMKVMSIARSLSLQVHPTKEQAIRLHERDPIHYPDRHHKPELAYALTQFELLCGFRPADEILANIEAFPPLRYVMDSHNCENLRDVLDKEKNPYSLKCRQALAACFGEMMERTRRHPDLVSEYVDELIECLDNGVRGCLTESTVKVIQKMSVDFPGDVGVFSPLILNHMILKPGECCYYAAEELHAYLSGECVECVGCSNNTIRAAMTPKFIDRDALCEVLNYRMTPPEDYLVPAIPLADYPGVDEYSPDCKDFQLHRIRVPSNTSQAFLPVLDCASIMVIVGGSAELEEVDGPSGSSSKGQSSVRLKTLDCRDISRGDIIYIPPGRRLRFTRCTEQLEAFRTFSYEIGPDHENRKVVKEIISTMPTKKPIFTIDNFVGKHFAVESEMDGFI